MLYFYYYLAYVTSYNTLVSHGQVHVFCVCCACAITRVSTCAIFKMDTSSESEVEWGEEIGHDESNSVISTPVIIH